MAKEFRLILTKEKVLEILNNADSDHIKIDVELSTRLATDLSNLDDTGVNKLDEYITNSSLSETVGINYQATLRNTDDISDLQSKEIELSQKVDENSDSWGHYAKRPPVDLSVKIVEENKIINRDGNMVERVGWNVAEFEAERGNTYLFNPGTMASDVCIFAEKVVREEVRNIDYKYEYNEDGMVSRASAAYNGENHSYTYTYTEEGITIIVDDATGEEVEALPLTYIASVGTYIPMTILPADAELPLDGYCRLVSHFESDTHITIAVSYNTENAGILMGVKRDGTVASICSQLSTLGKRISSLSKRVEDALEGLEAILKTI